MEEALMRKEIPKCCHLQGSTLETFLVLQMKDSLINLQNGIGSRDFGSDPEEKRKRFH